MKPQKRMSKLAFMSFWCLLSCFIISGQSDTSTFKAQLAFGVNNASSNGFIENFEGKSVNFPTVNLGLQYMFKSNIGGKLDYGFGRISNKSNTTEFKLNYSRINLQLVYDASRILSFSNKIGIFLHAGPGLSIVNPLGQYKENNLSFFNAMAGVEFHYGVSDSLTLFLDASYVLGERDNFIPVSTGFGAFNGNLLTIAFGASISLSGCYYCGD